MLLHAIVECSKQYSGILNKSIVLEASESHQIPSEEYNRMIGGSFLDSFKSGAKNVAKGLIKSQKGNLTNLASNLAKQGVEKGLAYAMGGATSGGSVQRRSINSYVK